MNNYQIIKEIGLGNHGRAVLVKNMIDNNLYIMKRIDISNSTPEQIDLANSEVNIIKSLNHPYIIKYIESFYDNQEEIILNWFVQLCFAVKYIHEKHILHRDLKLSNIFLSSNGDIKLGDFGTSKVLSGTNQYAESTVGTPYYLSPEICKKNKYREKSDIWSMGCVLYELMNLKHAFEAGTQLIMKIINGNYGPIQESYSSDLKNLLKELLYVNPEQRSEITQILAKPFLLKYIKLNLIKIISYPKLNLNKKIQSIISPDNKTDIFLQNEKNNLEIKEYKTRSSSFNENIKTCKNLISSALIEGSTSKDDSDDLMIKICKIETKSENAISDISLNTNNNMITKSKVENLKISDNSSPLTYNQKSSTFSKIEKLKKLLEKRLGLHNFVEIYSTFNQKFTIKDKSQICSDICKNYLREDIPNLNFKVVIKLVKSLIRLENSLYNQYE